MIVRESLYNFKRESDVITSSGLGKKALIEKWIDENVFITNDMYQTKLNNYIINDDFTIDIFHDKKDMVLHKAKTQINKNIVVFPEYIKFGIVDGSFLLSGCSKLSSLVGCPKIVNGSFSIVEARVSSLDGCPKSVKDFYVGKNLKKFTKMQIKKVCDVKGEIYIC